LAVDAAHLKFPANREINREFCGNRPFRWDFDAPIGEPIQWFTTKFPTQRNREFSNAYQGKFFKEQGIFMPDASILNFEQPQPTFAGTAPAKRP
jgi:hypothetical protein